MKWLINIIDKAVTFETDYYKHQTGGLYFAYLAIIVYLTLGAILCFTWCGIAIALLFLWEFYFMKSEDKPFSWKDIFAGALPILAIFTLVFIQYLFL